MTFRPKAVCERCGYLIYTATEAHKFCPNPRCRGWLHHFNTR